MKNRQIAYGENSYDIEGKPQTRSFDDSFAKKYLNYSSGEVTPTPATPADTTTKTLLWLAGGAVVATGILIMILGRRKK